MATLEDVLQLWLNNPEFRENFKKNPQDTLQNENLELSSDDFQKIQSYIKRKEEGDAGHGSDEELGKRISK